MSNKPDIMGLPAHPASHCLRLIRTVPSSRICAQYIQSLPFCNHLPMVSVIIITDHFERCNGIFDFSFLINSVVSFPEECLKNIDKPSAQSDHESDLRQHRTIASADLLHHFCSFKNGKYIQYSPVFETLNWHKISR